MYACYKIASSTAIAFYDFTLSEKKSLLKAYIYRNPEKKT